MTVQVSSTVLPLFLAAGWHPGRKVPLPDGLDCVGLKGHPALSALESFAGLRVGSCGAGVDCAKSDLEFEWMEDDYSAHIVPWESSLATRLIGIAWVHHRHGALYVASDGRCFSLSTVSDDFYFDGPDFAVASERLLLGHGSQRRHLRNGSPNG